MRERAASSTAVERSAETLPGVYIEGEAVKERRIRVKKALAELSAEQREVLDLAFFDGLTLAEIAERTRTPLDSLQARALVAMKQLRRSLRAEIRELM
jgi:RNA polymerase sigma-70 factor (ECF subfamily)